MRESDRRMGWLHTFDANGGAMGSPDKPELIEITLGL